MGQIDNLNDSNLRGILDRLTRLERAAPLNNAAIGRGGITVYDGGMITIENGGLRVTGSAEIIGTLIASGIINFTGDVTISGPLDVTGTTTISGNTTVTGTFTTNGPLDVNGTTSLDGDTTVNGPLHVNGATDINGNLDVDGTMDINGVTTLNNDMNVQGGGIINVGPNMSLNPAAFGGSIQFYSGGGVENASGVTAIKGAGNAGFISDTTASVFAASNSVNVSPSAVEITGPVELNSLTTTTEPANVYFDPSSKRLYYVP